MVDPVVAYAQSHQANYLAQLQAFLRHPSISTQDEHAEDVRRCAAWLVDFMQSIGLKHCQLISTAGHPVVYGDWLAAGPEAPTLLVYGHYDVQPVDPLEAWQSPPFEPTVRGDNLYARGATDDKGQLFIHLAAVDAWLKQHGELPVNIKFLLEGEEEIGSRNLEAFIREHADLLQADAAVISDTSMNQPGQPVMVVGLRGLAAFELRVQSANQDLHSGMYGGVVHNPLLALAEMLSKINQGGKITIPGFYDDVLPPEREADFDPAAGTELYRHETGAPHLWGEADYSPRERIGSRPTFEVHGIVGGYTAPGVKTVIPAEATAKITMRLVPHQDPHKIARQFEAYLQLLAPSTVQAELTYLGGTIAGLIDPNDPVIRAAAQAYADGFGAGPLFEREGGSIPVVTMFQQHLGLPVAMMGYGLSDDNLHAPNEKFHLPNFYQGIETSIRFMQAYAREWVTGQNPQVPEPRR